MAGERGPARDGADMGRLAADGRLGAEEMRQTESGREPTGIVLDIQRMSTEDGPGIRTTVFMKGCPLACAWCHNPESISPAPQVEWIGARCMGCGLCVEACPNGALSRDGAGSAPSPGAGAAPRGAPPRGAGDARIDRAAQRSGGLRIDRLRCAGCGECAKACPTTALSLRGERWSVESLFSEVAKDRAFFEKSGGGVTIGGGEATLQGRFVAGLLRRLSEAGLRTAIDTCGLVRRESLGAILPSTDLVLFDVKEIDSEKHREYTGQPNEGILENLGFIADAVRGRGRPSRLWIRTPMIPGATATEENVRGIGALIASRLEGAVEKWELLAFNNLCRDKYERLGLSWRFAETPLASSAEMERLAGVARTSGVDPAIVSWTGSTRLEEGEGGGAQ